MKPTIYYFLLLLSFACQTSIQPDKNYTKNQEALSTLEKLEVMEDFEVNLFAAEPLIADPVDMEIDENGNLYVVEMHAGDTLFLEQFNESEIRVDANLTSENL